MVQLVVTGASAMCSFGTAPGTVNATSQTVCMVEGKPAATIQDCQSANITPFGMCVSMANPQVAAATAAALGVLTPQPCMLVPAGTWIPTKPAVLVLTPCMGVAPESYSSTYTPGDKYSAILLLHALVLAGRRS